MINFLRPRYFFLGLVGGFISCCLLGYHVSFKARFHHFTRFFFNIGPAADYYPTASELLATAKHDIDPNKILILIGGSSIFRGEGQNPEELWSARLQKILGDRYKVLNYAFNGADFPAFGGVAFRILNEHFPKMLFVSTCSWQEEPRIDGGSTYAYLFWDAYYKKLFHPDLAEQKIIKQLRKEQMQTPAGKEMHLLSYLDSLFYFRNLWNWVSYKYIFTVWNHSVAVHPFMPKKKYSDDVYNIKDQVKTNNANLEKFNGEITKLTNGFFRTNIDLSKKHYKTDAANTLHKCYGDLFQPSYRAKTLCVVATYNPHHISALPKPDQQAHRLALKETQMIIKDLGYHAMLIKGLKPVDYYDLQHMVGTGGYKTAQQVAVEARALSKMNGYLS